jgi:bla regulator protein BlaR1
MRKSALSIAMATLTLTLAQTPGPEKRAAFEVASIRRAVQDGDHDSDTNGSLFRAHNLTLKRLIASAYEIDIGRIYEGPNWVDSEGYDITAKIPTEFVQQTRDRLPQMIQSLLADRFQLVIHREPRQVSGYALVVAKKGSKMEQAKPDGKGSDMHANSTHITAKNLTMEAFARALSRNPDIGELIVDKTGLTGGFNFALDWMPRRLESKVEPSPDDRPSIFTAVQEQLGLRLESAKVPIQAIVVDRAEKPEGN